MRRRRAAGADVLFVEAPRDREELRQVREALPDVPLVANMVEGGKTPLISAQELEQLGYALVIWPNSLIRRFVHAAREVLAALAHDGTTESELCHMASFDELNDLLGLPAVAELERRYVPEDR